MNEKGLSYIILKISLCKAHKWLCIGVYINPNKEIKDELFKKIHHISCYMKHSWLIFGDFNEILSLKEKMAW